MHRRRVLSVLGGSVAVGLAGCLHDNDDEGLPIEGRFEAESTAGLVIFDESGSESDFRNDGYGLPPSGEITDPVVMENELHDDGTWESINIDFPPIDLGLEEISPTVDDMDGFSGEYDEEEGLWTVRGDLRVTVEADGETFTLDFPLDATTKQSGALEGSFEEQDDTIHATIVDNESVVEDQFDNTFVDQSLGLPAPFEGDNWFELEMELRNIE